MPNNPTSSQITPGASKQQACVDELISPLIGAIGEPDFGQQLVCRINQLALVDFMSVYQLRSQSRPQMFLSSSRSGHDVSLDCFKSYQQHLHESDHTFDKAITHLQQNIPALAYTHNSHFAPAHRAAIYSRHGILDRISVVSSDNGLLLATNFYRFDRQPAFSDGDILAVQQVARSLANCVGKHIRLTSQSQSLGTGSIHTLASQLAIHCPKLSARELELCQGLLLGRTYHSIAIDMNVSLGTVKTYRARAFEKLEIHFRSQLFALAAQLTAPAKTS